MTTMRYVVNDTNPIPIYPGGKQGQVTIYCDSDNPCFVSTVASGLYPIPLGGRQSIRWDAGTALYALVQDVAATSAVVVIDSGVVLPSGTVKISGPLTVADILAPVLVQGGGEVLISDNFSLASGAVATFPVPLGVSGVRYPSLYLMVRAPGISDKLVYSIGVTGVLTLAEGAINRGANGAFDSGYVAVTIPWSISSGLTLTLENVGPGTIAGLSFTLTGATTTVSDVESNLAPHFFDATGGGLSWPVGSGQDWNFPSTFTPYDLVFTTTNVGTCDGLQAAVMDNVGVYSTFDNNLLTSNGRSTMGANDRFVYRSPGNGRPLRITTGTVAGLTVSLARSAAPRNFSILDAYPVGSIFFTTVNANPGTVFGGTWSTWGSGRVPVGVNAAQAQFATVEKTGGEIDHTLILSEIPAHAHDAPAGTTYLRYLGSGGNFSLPTGTSSRGTTSVASEGGGSAHNNLQPYITCYMWKRTS